MIFRRADRPNRNCRTGRQAHPRTEAACLSRSVRVKRLTKSSAWLCALIIVGLGLSTSVNAKDKDKEKDSPEKVVDSGSFGVYTGGQRVEPEKLSIQQKRQGRVV